MKEDHSYAKIFPLLEGNEFEQLVDDVKENGLIHSITLFEDKILDGRNRYRACLQAKVEPKFIEFSGSDPISFVISCNSSRRDLTASQRACCAVNATRLVNRLKREAKERQGTRTDLEHSAKVGTMLENGKTRDILAKRFKVSHGYVDDAFAIKSLSKQLKELAEKPETEWTELVEKSNGLTSLFGDVLAGRKSIADAKREKVRFDYEVRVVEAELEKRAIPQLVLADPPWQHAEPGATTKSRRVDNQYEPRSLDDIKSDIPTTSSDCILFLWAVQPMLPEALEVMNEWGFDYKTCAVWDKETIGLGHWFRSQHEMLLVGVKGKVSPPADFLLVSSIFKEKKTTHSKKPLCVYEWIEKAFPEDRKLEMYARKVRKGWGSMGNEI
jgi:N6-adenosine-specific RNA methylase IME4